jgi:orotidine-5'-phosphate decarboxylase
MTRQELIENIKKSQSFLCVGLDTDIKKLPECVRGEKNPMFAFNKAIIDATAPFTVAYKPNVAFYESQGIEGWEALKLTCQYLKEVYPDKFIIADAKRGDIGNTSKMYARAFFEDLDVDAVTVAPYMGEDSVKPFLEYTGSGKWVILLALTSNGGSKDFQMVEDAEGTPLYKRVLTTSKQWGNEENLMYVVGATKAEMLGGIREIVPDSFLLVPGVGAQGGSLEEVCRYGLNADCGLLVNSSRGIIYASTDNDFAAAAAREAEKLRQQMAAAMNQKK